MTRTKPPRYTNGQFVTTDWCRTPITSTIIHAVPDSADPHGDWLYLVRAGELRMLKRQSELHAIPSDDVTPPKTDDDTELFPDPFSLGEPVL